MSPTTHRLFFALWPEPRVVAALEAARATLAPGPLARKVPGDSLHITLAFLGEVEAAAVAPLIALARDLPVPAFTLRLDRIECWRRGGIVFAGSSAPCPALDVVVAGLRDALSKMGVNLDARPFVPHVTLFRDGRVAAQPLAAPIEWAVQGVRLVESVPGRGYVALWGAEG